MNIHDADIAFPPKDAGSPKICPFLWSWTHDAVRFGRTRLRGYDTMKHFHENINSGGSRGNSAIYLASK